MPNYSHGTKLALAAVDEPPFLTVGTDVSAKYKGAFCEAKIIEVSKNVKVRVLFEGGLGNHLIDDTDLKVGSALEVGAKIEAKHPEKKQQLYFAANITKILDHSRYTVVFDDGDRSVLRRSSICLKSGKHFAESETLDQLPLTNPEHFGNPVKVGQTTKNANNQSNCNNNNSHGNHNNNTSLNNLQTNQNEKQTSSKLDNNDPGEIKINNNNSTINKSLGSDNKSTPANGRAAAIQNTIKQETSDKSTTKTKTASATTSSALTTPSRRGGKGRKAKESLASNSKMTDTVDDHEDSSQDSAEADGGDPRVNSLIEVGVKLMVQYGKGKVQNVYEAKVNKIETNSAGKTRYFVHYTGWNNRYDEWVTRNRILSVVTDKENGVRDGRSKHADATNSTSSSNTASSNSSTKESLSVKEKDVSTPAKNPRRSRQVETASTVAPQTSTPVTAPNTTLTNSTVVATSARERDKSKDKNKEVPTKTRRTRNIADSSANSAATSSSASSTSSVVSGQVIVKDEPKEKETTLASAAPTKPGRPRLETRESVASTNSSSTNLTKEKDKEPPTKTRRSKQADANSTNTNCVVATNETAALSSPPRLATVKTEYDKVKNPVKDTQHSATKEDRPEKPQHSEPVSTIKSRSTAQNSHHSATTTTKDKDTEKEQNSVQSTKSRGSRQSESSLVASSMNPVLTASPTPTTTSTTTKVATVTSSVATTIAAASIASPATSLGASNSSPVVAHVTSRPARDRERDRETDKEPPTKIRRSRQAASEASEKTTTSNAATSSTVSTITTSSSTTSSNVNVANPSTASSASSSSSSSSSYSLTFSSNVMSAYNLIDKERFSDLPVIDEPDCDKRISILQDKIMAIKQTYMALRSELADLDRRKKRPRLERSNSDHINFSGVTCRN